MARRELGVVGPSWRRPCRRVYRYICTVGNVDRFHHHPRRADPPLPVIVTAAAAAGAAAVSPATTTATSRYEQQIVAVRLAPAVPALVVVNICNHLAPARSAKVLVAATTAAATTAATPVQDQVSRRRIYAFSAYGRQQQRRRYVSSSCRPACV